MKRAIVLGSLALLLAAIGCSPDTEPATTSCHSITECAIGKACDQTTHQCIKEPDNRFLGSFHCKISATDTGDLQISEVVGKADNERYALTNTVCSFDTENERVVILLSDLDGGETMRIDLKAGMNGRVAMGPAIRTGTDADQPFAILRNDLRFTREATSVSGFINLSAAIAEGAVLDAYLDVTMTLPPRHLDATLGEPCKNGLADCGTALDSVGGAASCFLNALNPKAVPVCSKNCTSNGDCALGKAVCNNGTCVRACTTDADCANIAQACFAPATGQESRGCHSTKN